MRYFDYESAAREAGIPEDKLQELVQIMQAEFPDDQMMAELHVLRACHAVLDGRATLDQVLAKDDPVEAPSAF